MRRKNLLLREARVKAGLTMEQVANKVGISEPTYWQYEDGRIYPSQEIQNKICSLYRSLGSFVLEEEAFPICRSKKPYVKKHLRETRTPPKDKLVALSDSNVKISCDGQEEAEYFVLQEQLEAILKTLSPPQEKVIKMRFKGGMSLEEVGKRLDLTRERIRQIQEDAIRRLRHPSRSKYLREFLE